MDKIVIQMRLITQPLIYVVDDDPDEHHLLNTIFVGQYADFTLRCFSDGNELLTQLTHCLDGRLPDLILLDWHMPIIGGHQVLQMLQMDSDWRSIPVVVRSSFQPEAMVKSCYELGAKAFVDKTSTFQQLIDSITEFCYTWSAPELCLN